MSLTETQLEIAARTRIIAAVSALSGRVFLSRARPVSRTGDTVPLVTVHSPSASADYLGRADSRFEGPVDLIVSMYASSTVATASGGETDGPEADLKAALDAVDESVRLALLANPRAWLPSMCRRVASWSTQTEVPQQGEGGALWAVRLLRLKVDAEHVYTHSLGTPTPLDTIWVDYHHSGDEDPDHSASIAVEQDE